MPRLHLPVVRIPIKGLSTYRCSSSIIPGYCLGKKYDAAVQQILVLISASLGRASKIPGFLGAPGLDQATGEHE